MSFHFDASNSTHLVERHRAALPAARRGTPVRAGDGPGGAAPLVGAQPLPGGLEAAAVPGVAAREEEVAALDQALGDQVPHTCGMFAKGVVLSHKYI